MGIQFDVNDQLSVILHDVDESDKNVRAKVANGCFSWYKNCNINGAKINSISIHNWWCYIGIAQADVDNSDYTAGKEESQTIVSLAIAF